MKAIQSWKIGNCLEILKEIPSKSVKLVLTDPPYDVNFASWDSFVNKGWLQECLRISDNVIFTPRIRNIYKYPQPKWIICWTNPGSTRRNDTGGFNHWEPLLYYGNKKLNIDFIYLPDIINHCDEITLHKCPKPFNLYVKIIELLTEEGDNIVDPFLGSGMLLKAAAATNRNAFGIEIDPQYESTYKNFIESGLDKYVISMFDF